MSVSKIIELLNQVDSDNFPCEEQLQAIKEACEILAHLKDFHNYKRYYEPLTVKEVRGLFNEFPDDAYFVVAKDDGNGNPVNNSLHPVYDISIGINELTKDRFIRLWV